MKLMGPSGELHTKREANHGAFFRRKIKNPGKMPPAMKVAPCETGMDAAFGPKDKVV